MPAYQDAVPDSPEGRLIRKLEDIYAQLQEAFAEGVYDAGTNFQKAENTTNEGGVRYNKTEKKKDSSQNKNITMQDVLRLRGIGRKSVSSFSSEIIPIAQKWADKYYKDLGSKSPFFRNWFGDWRIVDKTPVTIVKIPVVGLSKEDFKLFVKNQRGTVINEDTKKENGEGWEVRISSEGERNTQAHAGGAGLSVDALTAIRALIGNGILLDTEVHEHHSNNSKSESTDRIAFDHKLYSLGINSDNSIALYRITIEEIFQDVKHPHDKRFHNLKYIEKVADNIPGLTHAEMHSADTVRDISTTKYTVADLYEFVKQHDPEFNVGTTSSKVTGTNGKPLIMYHGTKAENGDFYIFDENKAVKKGGLGFKALGKGNYFTAKKLDGTERYGSRVIAAYLNIKTPFVYNGGMSFREQVSDDLGIDAESMSYDEIQTAMRNKGYDGVIQYDKNGDIQLAVTFDSNQIKSVENIGTFDGGNPDIRYSIGQKTDSAMQKLLEKENESLREDVDRLKELLKLQGKQTHGTVFTPSSVEAAARYLKKNAGAKGDTKALTKLLSGFYSYIASGEVTWEEVREKARPIANWLMDHVEHGRSDWENAICKQTKQNQYFVV